MSEFGARQPTKNAVISQLTLGSEGSSLKDGVPVTESYDGSELQSVLMPHASASDKLYKIR